MVVILAACAGPKLLDVAIEEGAVAVDHVPAVSISEVDAYPLDADLPPLAQALATRPAQPVTLTAGADDPWYRIRTLYLTTTQAGFGPVTFRAGRASSGPSGAQVARGAPGCNASREASGARPTVRIDLYGGPKESWVELSARFQPVIDGEAHDLPVGCWSGPACDAAFPAGPTRDACLAGEGGTAADRVTLGDATGCAAPIARAGAGAEWAEPLSATLRHLGLGPDHPVVISPEPLVPFGRFVETTEAVRAAGLAFPRIPEGMVQGNDGPPTCSAEIRDADALALAAARWYGANRLRD